MFWGAQDGEDEWSRTRAARAVWWQRTQPGFISTEVEQQLCDCCCSAPALWPDTAPAVGPEGQDMDPLSWCTELRRLHPLPPPHPPQPAHLGSATSSHGTAGPVALSSLALLEATQASRGQAGLQTVSPAQGRRQCPLPASCPDSQRWCWGPREAPLGRVAAPWSLWRGSGSCWKRWLGRVSNPTPFLPRGSGTCSGGHRG